MKKLSVTRAEINLRVEALKRKVDLTETGLQSRYGGNTDLKFERICPQKRDLLQFCPKKAASNPWGLYRV